MLNNARIHIVPLPNVPTLYTSCGVLVKTNDVFWLNTDKFKIVGPGPFCTPIGPCVPAASPTAPCCPRYPLGPCCPRSLNPSTPLRSNLTRISHAAFMTNVTLWSSRTLILWTLRPDIVSNLGRKPVALLETIWDVHNVRVQKSKLILGEFVLNIIATSTHEMPSQAPCVAYFP